MTRQHSWDESELKDLKVKSKEEFDQKWRMMEINKRFMKNKEQMFYCEICYTDHPVENITYLECGHYFCRDCMKGYYDYKLEIEGKALIKCPIQDC